MKKILEISLLIAAAAIIGWWGYMMFTRPSGLETSTDIQIKPDATPVREQTKPTPTPAPVSKVEEILPDEKEALPPFIEGNILDEKGNPVPDARIRLYKDGDVFPNFYPLNENHRNLKPFLSRETAGDGSFRFEDVPPGNYRIEVASQNHPDFWIEAIHGVDQGRPLEEYEIVAPSGASLEGVVLDPAKSPVAGSDVFYYASSHDMTFFERTVTNAEGRFVFEHAPLDANILVMASAKGFAPAYTDRVRCPAPEISIRLFKPASRKGTILLPGGKPARGAEIRYKMRTRREDRTYWLTYSPVKADENGNFVLGNLPPGRLTVTIHGTGDQADLVKTFPINTGAAAEPLTIRLERGNAIAGSVVDDEGTSIAGARLSINNRWGDLRWFESDSKGRFKLRGGGEEPVHVYVHKHGFAPVITEKTRPGVRGMIVSLNRGATVTGGITEKNTRRPISRAFFKLNIEGRHIADRMTNARGQYQALFLPPRKNASTRAASRGFSMKKGPDLDLASETLHQGIDFFLGSGGAISGHILEMESGNPVPGAMVTSNRGGVDPAYSNDKGLYILENVPEGANDLSVEARGFVKPPAVRVSMIGDQDVKDVDIFLRKGAGISGKVVDSSGKPIEGARLGARWGRFRKISGPQISRKTTFSDQDGIYLLEDLPPETDIQINAGHQEYAPAVEGPFHLKPGERRENVNITLTAGGAISGIITDLEGIVPDNPRAACSEGIGEFFGAEMGSVIALFAEGSFTDAEDSGKYEIKHLAPGNYMVLARAKDCVYGLKKGIQVEEGKKTGNIDFKLSPSVSLAGVVRDDTGEPVPDARVTAFGMDFQKPGFGMDQTDASGYFKIEGLLPRPYMVKVEKNPYPNLVKMNVPAPDQSLELILETGGTIRGVVLDDATGDPVSRYTIKALFTRSGLFGGNMGMMSNDREYHRTEQVNNPEGTFEIKGLKQGKYKLQVNADGYAEEEKPGFKIASLKVIEGVEIKLKTGVQIEGRVVSTLDDSPVPGAVVKLEDSDSNVFGVDFDELRPQPVDYSRITDREGKFTIRNLTAGLTTFQAKKDGYLTGKKMMFVRDDVENEECVIEISPGASVTGRVISKSTGEPVVDAEVTFLGQGFLKDMIPFFRDNASTNADGKFTLTPVPPGTTSLKISHKDYSVKIVENVELGEGESKDVGDVELTSGGGIAGFVLDVASRPVSDALLIARREAEFRNANTNSEGEYSFDELSPGLYTVQLIENQDGLMMGQTGNVQEKQVTVTDGEVAELNFILVPGYTLSGKVTKNGEPATGMYVSCQSADPLTPTREGGNIVVDSEGRYEFTEVQPGNYHVSVYRGNMHQGQEMKFLFVGAVNVMDDTIYDIDLPVASISGRVMDAESGDPVAGAMVSVVRSTDPHTVEDIIKSGRWGDVTDSSDSDGFYKLDEVQEGDFYITVRHEEYSYDLRPLTLGEGENKSGVDFSLKPGLALNGRAILRETGSPPSRLFIHLVNQDNIAVSNEFASVSTDGSFSIGGLRAGSYVMDAYPQGAAPIYRKICLVSADAASPVELEFPKGGTLSLEVKDKQGGPVSQARVSLATPDGFEISYPPNLDSLLSYNKAFFTDENGTLERSHIPSGNYILTVNATGYEKGSLPVDIVDGQTHPQTLTLDPGSMP